VVTRWRVMMRRTRRRKATSVAALLAALCAVALMPGQALGSNGPGGAAEYRTAEDAKKIRGAASSGDGPQLKPGFYLDSIGQGDKKYYSVNLDAKSSAFISVVAVPEPGSKVPSTSEGLKLDLKTAGGYSCRTIGGNPAFNSAQGTAYPIADYVTRVIGMQDECQQKGPYLLSVERITSETSDPSRWPLEIRYMSEPGLKGSQPAAPGDNGADDETPPPVTGGTKKTADGGTGFNDAGAVASGVWKDRIKPGETRFYRVPVDWGQRLSAAAELGTAKAPGDYPPTIYNGMGVTAYNPARGAFDSPNFVEYGADEPAQARAFTPVVDYGNRFATSGYDAPLAGWYYLAVTVSPELEKYFKNESAPLTLRIDVKGDAEPGPEYAGDPAKAGFGVSEEDKEQAANGQTAEEAQRSDTLQLVAYAGIGAGVVLILGLSVWWLMARRQAVAGGAGAPALGGPAQGQGLGPAGSGPAPSSTVPLWPQQQDGRNANQGQGYGQGPPQGWQ
jgi:hypothetical protein